MTWRGVPAAALLAACAVVPACTTVVVPQPTLDRELAAALEARRVAALADRVIEFRDGLHREAVDGDRLDHAHRAAAARRVSAELRGEAAAVHRGRLDREAAVDLDLCLFLLDAAEEETAEADGDDARLRAAGVLPAALDDLVDPRPDARLADRLGAAADATLPDGDTAPPPEWSPVDIGRLAGRASHGARLLRRRGAEAAVLLGPDGEDLHRRASAAADRLERFRDALLGLRREREKEGAPEPPVDAATFARLLRAKHGVTESPAEVEAWGAAQLDEALRELDALAAAAFPGRTWKEALAEIRADHPDAPSLPAEALAAATDARDFCIRRGIVTIPEAAREAHVEIVGDDMARSYPFAAYGFRTEDPAGPSGRYLVSPGATWMDGAQRVERLRGNCRAWTRVVAAHETWPGHHLQFWWADHETSRLRREAATSVYVEGWGFYCEGLLERHGFFPTPAERLSLLVMRAWRAARVVLDVRLHGGGATFDEAVAFLVDRVDLTRDAAAAEVRRYLAQPTQPFGYAWGRREIERLRGDEERRLGPAFSERAFHDRLLRCGPVPFPFVRRLFGYDVE